MTMNYLNWDDFHFLRPLWLWSALLLPPLLWLAWKQRSAVGSWQRICDPRLLRQLIVGSEARASRWPLLLFGLGWLGAGLALAGPTWERLPQPVFEDPSSTMIVLDLSPSMDTREGSQSRLVRARHKTIDALEHCRGGQVGLVAFAGDPYPIMPLSDDPELLASTLPMLTSDLMPGRGVDLGAALDEASELLRQAGVARGRILVLADSAGDDPLAARRAAGEAAQRGYQVAAIGIGPESEALREVARAGGGRFARLSVDDSDLVAVLPASSSTGLALEESDGTNSAHDEWRDMGPWLMLIPLALAALAFRKGWTGMPALLFVGALGGPNSATFQPAQWFQRADQRAQVAFEEGRPQEAAQLFRDPRWRAASLYRAGQYEQAGELLAGLRDPESRYNLGNALARQGKLEEAIAAYDEALATSPAHEDARFNRDLLKKLLEERKKKEDQQKQQQEQDGGRQDSKDPNQQGRQSESRQDPQESQQQGQQGQQNQQNQQGQQGQQDEQQDQQGQQSQPGQEDQAGLSDRPDSAPDQASQAASPQPSGNAKDGSEDRADTEDRSSPQAEYDDVADSGAAAGRHDRQTDEQREPNAIERAREPVDEQQPRRAARSASDGTTTEQDQAVEQWLGRIPDDPAGLLRAKILRRYYQRHPRRP